MNAAPFVHLHVHTEYSLVDSTVRIAALMDRCSADGMRAVALTDQNNLFGMVKFYKKALAAGVKPIIGVDLRIVNEDDSSRPFRLILLCQNNIGYKNLSTLLTRAFLEGQVRGEPTGTSGLVDTGKLRGLDRIVGRIARGISVRRCIMVTWIWRRLCWTAGGRSLAIVTISNSFERAVRVKKIVCRLHCCSQAIPAYRSSRATMFVS